MVFTGHLEKIICTLLFHLHTILMDKSAFELPNLNRFPCQQHTLRRQCLCVPHLISQIISKDKCMVGGTKFSFSSENTAFIGTFKHFVDIYFSKSVCISVCMGGGGDQIGQVMRKCVLCHMLTTKVQGGDQIGQVMRKCVLCHMLTTKVQISNFIVHCIDSMICTLAVSQISRF